jgi:myo-inositol-1(or 4)-monophosphatase
LTKASVPISEIREACEQAARAGAEQLLSWRGRFSAREKAPRDLVTDADLASEQAIRRRILEQFPDHGLYGEESRQSDQWERTYTWVVDPLDGTANYVHGVPLYAVSIAVVCGGELLAGVILDPERRECFSAGRGLGATLNGEPIHTSSVSKVEEAMLAVSFPAKLTAESPDLRQFNQLAPRCQAVRRTGSAALNLAYVACGRFDGHWAHEIHPWDSAAGVLLVQEAGGAATACRGGPYEVRKGDYLAAATPDLHRLLLGFA